MKFSPAIRTLLALMLCLLLPLQAGATLARATAMARHGGMSVPTGVAERAHERPSMPALVHGTHDSHGNTSVPPSQEAHAGHHGDHVDHGDHSKHGHTGYSGHSGYNGHNGHDVHGMHGMGMTPADSDTGSHKSVHAKAGCADCAKCCLLAASAPPPASAACFTPDAVRVAFLAQRAPAPSFLTDGPERPPRHLAC